MHCVFPPAEYRATKSCAREDEETLGLGKAPMKSLSGSSWMMWPGDGSALPMRDTPESTVVVGWDDRKGFSMFRPFCIRTIVVWVLLLVRAGVTRSITVGGTSGMFLVERRR
jgi:hypothetical protein